MDRRKNATMKAYPIAAALLSLGLAASGILPAVAQTAARGRLLTRPAGAQLSHRGPMPITTSMMPAAQIHAAIRSILDAGDRQDSEGSPADVQVLRIRERPS